MKDRESAIVTTGGTKEPIDDVRFITNFSTGKFGYAIARHLVEAGYSVKVLSPKETPALAGYRIEEAEHVPFTDTESLRQSLLGEEQPPTVVFHAAAVSDYRPKRTVEGKMSSSEDDLTIELERTPKILASLREQYGNTSFLVGFKLLSGVSRRELVDVALEQTKKNRLNLAVANDLQQLKSGIHPVILVTAEGGAINLSGDRDEVGQGMVDFVNKRANVQWYHTEKVDNHPEIPEEERAKFADALRFMQDSHLLYDSSGNVSMRHNDLTIITPRGVDKSITQPEEASVAKVDHESNIVYAQGEKKSSIDTAVSDMLYRAYPDVKQILHFHTPWGLTTDKTEFPYPCGVKEEGEEILERLGTDPSRKEFAIELLHHGFLVGLPDEGVERLKEEWEQNVEEFREHLLDVNQPERLDQGTLKPIFHNTNIVGVFGQYEDGAVVYLGEGARGKGVGKKIVQQLIERQVPIVTIDDCNVVDFYRRNGFAGEKDPETGRYTFYPPQPAETDPLFERVEEWKIMRSS